MAEDGLFSSPLATSPQEIGEESVRMRQNGICGGV